MNWYKIAQKADPRIDYETETMVPYKPSYMDIGHEREDGKVFLWYIDKYFGIHTMENKHDIDHREWDEFNMNDFKGNAICQGRYEVESGRVSLGGYLKRHFRSLHSFRYAKKKIIELLYKTFGGAIKIVEFI